MNLTKNLLVPKQFYFWAALLWTGIISFLSLLRSNEIPVVQVSNIDKIVHAFFYFVFNSLWFLFFKKQLESISKALAVSFLLSVFFGIGIEIMQESFTKTRQGDIMDVLANTSGAILAVCVILIHNKFISSDKIYK